MTITGATRAAAFVCVVSACGVAGEARAFLCTLTDEDASISWAEREVLMRPTRADGSEVSADQLRDALFRGEAQWNGPGCSDMELIIGASTDELRAGFDYAAGKSSNVNQNVVVFRNGSAGDPVDEWIHLSSNLAITTVTFLRSTAELLDADIEVNDAGFVFTACDPPDCQLQHDLENTLTHELGHVLGLDHPPSSQPNASTATMFSTSSEGDVGKRTIEPDDIDGLCALYPSGAGKRVLRLFHAVTAAEGRGNPAGRLRGGRVADEPSRVRLARAGALVAHAATT